MENTKRFLSICGWWAAPHGNFSGACVASILAFGASTGATCRGGGASKVSTVVAALGKSLLLKEMVGAW